MRRVVLLLGAILVLLAGCGGSSHRSAGSHRQVGPHHSGFATQAPPRGLLKVAAPQSTLEMYDSIVVSTVPANPRAVAGYTSGFWPTFGPLVAAFPHALHVSIAINIGHSAQCLDDEPGDATVDQVVPWVRAELTQGQARPCVYASVSQMFNEINPRLAAAGLAGHVRRWCAWYRYFPGLIAGCDAVQWTDHALGRNLDESTVATSFFGIAPTPKPDKYRILDRTKRQLGHGITATERNTVKTNDRLACHAGHSSRRGCGSTRLHARLLAGRLERVYCHGYHSATFGEPCSWGSVKAKANHAGARHAWLVRVGR